MPQDRIWLLGEILGFKISDTRYAARESERFFAAGDVDESHPSVARAGKFDDVKFYQVVRIDPGKARVLAKLTDGTPLLVEKQFGAGRLLIFASPFDNIANDLPLHASFVPFVEQSALYLSGGESVPAQYAVDSFVDLKNGGEIIAPDGKRALSLTEPQDARVPAFARRLLGSTASERPARVIAAHADRRESDLAIVPERDRRVMAKYRQSWSGRHVGRDEPKTIRCLVVRFAGVLVAAVIESVFAGKYMNPEQDEPIAQQAGCMRRIK